MNGMTIDEWLAARVLPFPHLNLTVDDGDDPANAGGGSGGDDPANAGGGSGGEDPANTGGGSGGDGGDNPWFADLGVDDENRHYLERVGFKSLNAALKHGRDVEKKLGVPADRLVRLPDVDYSTDPEAWADVVNRLGVPDGPEGYEFKDAEKVFGDNTERQQFVQKAFAEAGVPQPFAQAALDVYQGLAEQAQKDAAQAEEAAYREAESALKQEWGATYDDKVDLAQSMKEDMPEDFQQFLADKDLLNNPHIIRLLAEAAEARQETGTLPGRRDGGGGGKLTRDEMKSELREFDERWGEVLQNKTHRMHDQKVKERVAIIQRATG